MILYHDDGRLMITMPYVTKINRAILPTTNDGSDTHSEKTSMSKPDNPQDDSQPVELDIDLVLAKAKAHQSSKIGRIKCHNLPEFEALHDPGSDEGDKHLESEIERLKVIADKSEDETFAWGTDTQGTAYADVSSDILLQVIDQLCCNIAIIQFKNALIVVENLRWCHWNGEVKIKFQRALHELRNKRQILVSRFVQTCSFIDTNEPPKLVPGTPAFEVYDELIDYVTACVYRFILCSADGTAWSHSTLAVLARVTRKLKDLKTNARQCADDCIAGTEFLHDDLKDENSDRQKRYVFCIKDMDPVDILDDTEFIREYFLDQYEYRQSLCGILEIVLYSLWDSIDSSNSSYRRTRFKSLLRSNFDYSTLIQGKQGEQALVVTSDGHETISITNTDLIMSFAYTGCRLLLPLARSMAGDKTRPHNRDGAIVLRWRWGLPPHSERDMAYIEGVGEFISTIIHLTLASSTAARFLSVLATFVLALPGQENDLDLAFPPSTCRVAFNLQTTPSTAEEMDRTELMTLTAYALSQQLAVTPSIATATSPPGASLLEEYHADAAPRISLQWVIDSETIVIRCRRVVLLILAPTLAIAGAGIVLLLVPYHKPPDVDPSNFMIFLWSIALSFLLVAKAFYVPDWPWHDFLRGEVQCRSVSEVSRITGIAQQLVLIHLLSHERELALRVKGPYSKLFSQCRNDESNTSISSALSSLGDETLPSKVSGFSIDVPITLEAVYASGFLIVKVLSFDGPRLVFVDGRQGSTDEINVWSAPRKHLVADLDGMKKGRTEPVASEAGATRRAGRGTKETTTIGTSSPPAAAAGPGTRANMRLFDATIIWQHVNVVGLYVDKRASFL